MNASCILSLVILSGMKAKKLRSPFDLTICAVTDLETFLLTPVTHMLSIWDTDSRDSTETIRFAKLCRPELEVLECQFDDPLGYSGSGKVATAKDIRKILQFVKPCGEHQRLLVHHRAGVARSPAVAYAALCQAVGSGGEYTCLRHIFELRHIAEPDREINRIADRLL